MRLILGSSSPYRKALVERLMLPFEVISPDIDESEKPSEQPPELVERLAIEKAEAVANRAPDGLIIGSDQVAVHDGIIVGKPCDHQDAVKQLQAASGKSITLYTGLALLNADSGTLQSEVVPYSVQFRKLNNQWIDRYLRKEQPYGCAGSLRADGLGIALLERFEGNDPNALIGLPMIALVRMLENEGIDLYAEPIE